jgi:hypothetical protein
METDIAVEDVASLPSSQTRKEHRNPDEKYTFMVKNCSFIEKN